VDGQFLVITIPFWCRVSPGRAGTVPLLGAASPGLCQAAAGRRPGSPGHSGRGIPLPPHSQPPAATGDGQPVPAVTFRTRALGAAGHWPWTAAAETTRRAWFSDDPRLL